MPDRWNAEKDARCNSHAPRCPVTGKISHTCKADAKAQKKRQIAHGASNVNTLKTFKCPHCGFFHLGNNWLGLSREELRERSKA